MVLILATLFSLRGGKSSADPGNRDEFKVGSALVGLRPVEGRLTGGFSYAPYGRSSVDSRESEQFTSRLPELRQELRASLHGRAILDLLFRDLDGAASKLSELTDQQPNNFRAWSDLSAVYIQRFKLKGHPVDLIKAIDASGRASVLAPKSPEARFNLALSLERLYLTSEARIQWNSYLKLDQASGWADEADNHLRLLAVRTGSEIWEQRRSILELQGYHEKIAALIVTEFREPARRFCEEELLPKWAEAILWGRKESHRLLDTCEHVGEALYSINGDRLLKDSIAAIRGASAGDGEKTIKVLAMGHVAYGHGLRLTESGEDLKALKKFMDSARWLEKGGSPFHEKARIAAGYSEFYRGNHASLPARLIGLPERLANQSYLSAASKTQLLLGLSYLRLADLPRSLECYREALRGSSGSGEPESVAAAHFMIAENLRFQGESDDAWKSRYRALALTSGFRRSIYRHNTMFDMAEAALKQGFPRAALLIQNEMVTSAKRHQDGLLLTESLIRRSRTRLRLNDIASTQRDLASATSWNRQLPNDTRRDQLEADIKATVGDLALKVRPSTAVAPLGDALLFTQSHRLNFRLPTLLYKRALAWLAKGEVGLAETDLKAGILEAERQRARLLDQQLRVAYSEDLQRMFDAMIKLQAGRQDREASFLFAERSRTRNLLETLPSKPEREGQDSLIAAGTITPSELQEILDPGVLLIEYVVLPEELLCWTVTKDGFDLHATRIKSHYLDQKVAEMNTCFLLSCGEGQITALLEELYDVLLGPISAVEQNQVLIVVPDKELNRVPFAALVNKTTGHYVIQERMVGNAPSATLYAKALQRDRELHGRSYQKLLAIGNPSFNPRIFASFTSLPAAEAEARRIAQVYTDAQVLTGTEASRQMFFQEAPKSDVVHVAAHARVNTEYPLLSMLLLAGSGGKNTDGVVYGYEMYSLRFHRTRLVVLSGCETAAGRIYAGEGVASLARPFLAAGVPVVVGSLWSVNDQSSMQFFRGFHYRLSSGQAPLVALQATQREFIGGDQTRLRNPYFWAGYQLLGGSAL